MKPYCIYCFEQIIFDYTDQGNKVALDYCIHCDKSIPIVFWMNQDHSKVLREPTQNF